MKQKGICKGVIKKVCKFSLGHAKVESTQGRKNKVAKKAISIHFDDGEHDSEEDSGFEPK